MTWIVLAGVVVVGGTAIAVRRYRGGNSGAGTALDAATHTGHADVHAMHTLHEGQTHH